MEKNPVEKSALIGDALKKPRVFLLITLAPQIILLALNLQSYFLIAKEISLEHFQGVMLIFISELILIGTIAGLFIYYFIRKKLTGLPACWIILAASIAYLWIFSFSFADVIPSSVSEWIMPPNRLLFYQFAFTVPAAFYAVLRIAAFGSKAGRTKDFVLSLLLLIIPPALWYVWMMFFRNLSGNLLSYNIINYVITVILIFMTVLMVAALARVLLLSAQWLKSRGSLANGITAFIFALALPITGLIVNISISFPADFQYPAVYVLTVLNALLLMAPRLKNNSLENILFLLRGLFYPFSLYFFIVFLPFIPFSVPAVVYYGAGLLLLSPPALFILHTKRLFDDLPFVLMKFKKASRIAILAAAALVPPLIFTSICLMDKTALNTAVKPAFEPDYTAPHGFQGSRFFLERAIENMVRFKSGKGAPFVSSFYNWLVFDNLVLPDEKIRYLSILFFGREITAPGKRAGFDMFDIFGLKPVRIGESVSGTSSLPETPVKLSGVELSSKTENGFTRTLVTLKMKNGDFFNQEFLSEISLPEGVFVSKFSLMIGKDRVEGRIFEKRTALWVYEMIRSYRRDPAVLYYRNKETLLLRVFPFNRNEEREVRMELLYPDLLAPRVKIGGKTLTLKGAYPAGTKMPLIQTADSGAVLLPGSAASGLRTGMRTPYLHFIIDRSAESVIKENEIKDKISAFRKFFPECRYYALTLANYESADVPGTTGDFFEAEKGSVPELKKFLPLRGGFSPGRAVKRVLLTYMEKTRALPGPGGLYCPVIIVITGKTNTVLQDNDWEYFDALLPDMPGYYLNKEKTKLVPFTFTGKKSPGDRFAQSPVSLLKTGGTILPLPAGNKSRWLFTQSKKGPFELYEYDWKASVYKLKECVFPQLPQDYSMGIDACSWHIGKTLNPSLSPRLWKKIVLEGKKSGVLNPDTSYIVVENDAQWKILKEKEKQKLNNAGAMDNFKTPEPPLIILTILLLILFSRRYMKSRAKRMIK